MTAIGGVIGLLLAFGLSRVGQGLLFGVTGLDPVVAGGTTMVMLCVALLAAAVPMRRAASVEPVAALRAE